MKAGLVIKIGDLLPLTWLGTNQIGRRVDLDILFWRNIETRYLYRAKVL
jgi:hypothetical protein